MLQYSWTAVLLKQKTTILKSVSGRNQYCQRQDIWDNFKFQLNKWNAYFTTSRTAFLWTAFNARICFSMFCEPSRTADSMRMWWHISSILSCNRFSGCFADHKHNKYILVQFLAVQPWAAHPPVRPPALSHAPTREPHTGKPRSLQTHSPMDFKI